LSLNGQFGDFSSSAYQYLVMPPAFVSALKSITSFTSTAFVRVKRVRHTLT
jgi:hypothetical protein